MSVRGTKTYPKYGDQGEQVKKYQKLLAKTGSKIQITGEFSIGMTSAIKAFQRKNKIRVTGVLDTATAQALEGYKAPRKTIRK